VVKMLTENGKKWIAEHFGKLIDTKYCYVSSGINYTDPAGNPATGGTADVVMTLVTGRLVGNPRGPNGETYDDMKAGNDGNDVTVDDAKWVLNNDGDPAGEPQYCFTPEVPPPVEMGYLTVTSNIPDAGVWVDDKYIGTVPITKYELRPATYTVKVAKYGYEPCTKDVTIETGEETSVYCELKEMVAPPPPGVAKACFKIYNPKGEELKAWVYIDGKHTWRQTPECFDLSPGDHDIKFEKDGYEPLEVRISLTSGEEVEYEYVLTPLPEEVPKIEIEVVEKGISGELLLDYSWIPSEVIRGASTRFRLYMSNNGGVSARYELYVEFEHITTKEKYIFWATEEDMKEVVEPGTGKSYYIPVKIPRTATLGTYWLYAYYRPVAA